MDACCVSPQLPPIGDNRAAQEYRRVLWIALGVNAGMFVLETVVSLIAGSVSVQADALDFLGDAANYTVALVVLGMATRRRAAASLMKAAAMGAFGIWVAVNSVLHGVAGFVPRADLMGGVGLLALVANLSVAILLFRHRTGDSNRMSVWICTRNDALINIAVIFAGVGVWLTGTRWPDIAVAAVAGGLALSGAYRVMRIAIGEWRQSPPLAA